jgi:N-acetyl-gamma-glutamyl-phosphate reductase
MEGKRMGVQVAVAGASGYAGGELLRLLACHPGMALGPVFAGAQAGEQVITVHPHLVELAGRRFEPLDPHRLAQADLVFIALPHGRSAAVAADLPPHVKIVDLGADFRLADPAVWQQFYGGTHAGCWTYGLPELAGARARIRGAARVAAPGCFATAAVLALAPLLRSGLAEPSDIVVVAASGTSGAGRAPQPHLHGAEVMGAMSAYQAGGVHRHTPEIEQALAGALPGRQPAPDAKVTVSFTPSLAPMPRGILATCTARITHRAAGADASAVTALLRGALADAYADEPFVHLLPGGAWPSTAATAGSNAVHLQAAADTRAGRAVVVAAIDNLGKGAAGQAVQNANLMTGLPESAGLTAHGVAP